MRSQVSSAMIAAVSCYHESRMAIPRYRPYNGPVVLSAGFRPFFLAAALWAALAIPLWLLTFAGEEVVSTALPPLIWHVHEMVFGYGSAAVAGFLLTAIPNWTGRMPLQGGPLAALVYERYTVQTIKRRWCRSIEMLLHEPIACEARNECDHQRS